MMSNAATLTAFGICMGDCFTSFIAFHYLGPPIIRDLPQHTSS